MAPLRRPGRGCRSRPGGSFFATTCQTGVRPGTVTVLGREADLPGWRRWRLGLELPPGLHTLAVRAVDGTGQVQAAERLPPHPSGASGYHRIVVRVRSA